jgi:hypothetical protein
MKRLFVLLPVLLLFGCGDVVYYTVSITNNTSKTVAYSYNDLSDTLAPSGSIEYQVKAYTLYPSNIAIVPPGPLSIKLIRKNDNYFFEAVPSMDLHVTNILPFSVKITSGNYIDADGAGSTELTVSSGAQVSGAIYTANPQFSITADYPVGAVKVEWKINNGEMYVTIG